MPFTDPMADGPAIQASGLRALKSGQNMKRTLSLVREFRGGDDATPVVLMGYYNPIYIYGVEKFLADAKQRRRRWPDRRRSSAGGGYRTVPAGAQGRFQLHPARHADDRRQTIAEGAPEHIGLCLLRLHHRHHRFGGAGRRKSHRGGGADQAPYRPAGLCRLWRAHRRAGAGLAQGADGVVVGSALVEAVFRSLDADGAATPATPAAVADLVRMLADGVRGGHRVAASAGT